MLVPLAAMSVSTVIGVAIASGMLAVIIWRQCGGAGPDGAEDSDSDDAGGGGGRRRPRRPPPVGPVSWIEFERQFAAYVENHRAGRTDRRSPARDRIANAGRHGCRGR
jgi:hypothetical protein